ncbi:MAG TPA: CoA pyrophosphatase [Thermoanaerobaculia bacterium]|jgi:8-oxo-dGTP pyrophosphatase MutT (NUDIX family)
MPPRFDERALTRLRERLAVHRAIEIQAPELKRASVLIPIIREREHFSLIFSRRAENMAAHSGQIAFPGGGVEKGETLTDAVLREAEEEVGIPRRAVELIGRLDDLVTNSGFLVAPFVAVVRERIEYVMQESEVAEVFEVPIDALLDVRYPEVRYVTFRKKRYPAYFYPYKSHEIWGLTGRIVKSFLDLVWQSV